MRIVAVIIDYIVIVVIVGILGMIIGFSLVAAGRFGVSMVPLILFIGVVPFLYYTFFEAYMNGQTVGKMLVKIKVVKEDGSPIDIVDALIRNVLRIIDSLPVLYLLGLVLIASSDKKQRLGDIVAKTVVVKAE
ncbi:MAG: RDD family protein [Candidatus Methanofastidiosia archaeon]